MPNTQRLIQFDIPEVRALKNVKVEMPDEDDVLNYIIWIKVEDGLYKDHWFRFKFEITPDWPITPPIITILDDIWHVNIRLVKDGGRVCVSLLSKEEYKPSTPLYFIVESLKYILVNPNENNPLNFEAAEQYNKNPQEFENEVYNYLKKMKQ